MKKKKAILKNQTDFANALLHSHYIDKKKMEILLENQIEILGNQTRLASMLGLIYSQVKIVKGQKTPAGELLEVYAKRIKDAPVIDWRSPKRIEKMRKKREAYLEKENEE